MAIIPEAKYPGKISPASPEYPYGQARNVATPGDGRGTPWEATLLNDIFGFQQAMLVAGGITPSGDPERANESQYLQALNRLYRDGRPTENLLKAIQTWSVPGINDRPLPDATLRDYTVVGEEIAAGAQVYEECKQITYVAGVIKSATAEGVIRFPYARDPGGNISKTTQYGGVKLPNGLQLQAKVDDITNGVRISDDAGFVYIDVDLGVLTTGFSFAGLSGEEGAWPYVSSGDLEQTLGNSPSVAMSQRAVSVAVQAVQDTADAALSIASINELASVTWNMDTDTYSGRPYATPVHKAMKRCLVMPDGTVNYYLNEFDSTKKENGVDAAVLDGTEGQVMVEIPKTYVRTISRGSQVTWEVSHVPLPGFELHPAFEGGAVEKTYIGAYDAVVWQASGGTVIDGLNLDSNVSRVNLTNDKLYSTSGNFAMVGLTRDEFRKLARVGGYQLYDYFQWQLVQLLWLTEYGDWNSQAVLGRGNVDGGTWPANSSNQGSSLNKINGLSNQFGNYSGSVAAADGQPFVTFRGIENIWGNCWQFIDGVNVNNRQIFVSNNEVGYADDLGSGDYSALGVALPTASDSAIKNWQPVANLFIPKVVGAGATTSTFVGDSLWVTTGWATMYVGGSAIDASSAGLCACLATDAASLRNRSRGARLSKKFRPAP